MTRNRAERDRGYHARQKAEAEEAAKSWVPAPRPRVSLVRLVDSPQISDDDWQKMARGRLAAKQSTVRVKRRK